jgi:hypothetical protein
MDVVTSFWNKLEEMVIAGHCVSIDKVKKELFKNEDELKNWCQITLPGDFFRESTSVIGSYTKVIQWANSKSGHYQPGAISEFMEADNADAWLAAYALEHNCKIVTYETSRPNMKRRIKIPEACDQFSIPFTDTIGMMRELGVRF